MRRSLPLVSIILASCGPLAAPMELTPLLSEGRVYERADSKKQEYTISTDLSSVWDAKSERKAVMPGIRAGAVGLIFYKNHKEEPNKGTAFIHILSKHTSPHFSSNDKKAQIITDGDTSYLNLVLYKQNTTKDSIYIPDRQGGLTLDKEYVLEDLRLPIPYSTMKKIQGSQNVLIRVGQAEMSLDASCLRAIKKMYAIWDEDMKSMGISPVEVFEYIPDEQEGS